MIILSWASLVLHSLQYYYFSEQILMFNAYPSPPKCSCEVIPCAERQDSNGGSWADAIKYTEHPSNSAVSAAR